MDAVEPWASADRLRFFMDAQHPTKLDRLMHAVAEHHPLRASVELAINDFRVLIESNSEELIIKLRQYFRGYLAKIQGCDLRLVAIEASAPELGLRFKPRPHTVGTPSREEEYADIDGGRVVRRSETGLQFLLGPDMTLAVGACVENQNQLISLVNSGCGHRDVTRG
jgi:HprK-related kinase B